MILLNRTEPEFAVGQIVRHRRYGYRGLVVALTTRCGAPDQWYQGNQTQPDKDQPWYHVLVHDSEAITYAAQSSLTAEQGFAVVQHPLVEVFFEPFDEQKGYVRNDREWSAMS